MIACWEIKKVPYGKRTIDRLHFNLGKYAQGAPKRDNALYEMATKVAIGMKAAN